MASNTLIINKEGYVTYIYLNRPDKFNSFNKEMAIALQDELKKAEQEKSCRCIILSGQGKAFCAGQDLSEAIDKNGPGIKTIVEQHYNPLIQLIRNIKKPVIAAVNGVAAGAGANIALSCDIVVASENASFIQAFSKIALVPDSGGTFFLPKLIGLQRASALMMTGDKVPAQDALQMGMIYKIFSADIFNEAVLKLAEDISKMPTLALVATKELLNQSFANTLTQQLQKEGEYQTELAGKYDYNEGVNAFLEKRVAIFKGE